MNSGSSSRIVSVDGDQSESSPRSMIDIPGWPRGHGASPPIFSGRTVTVIDASALVAFVLREDRWESIEEVLRETPSSVELLPLEAANAVLIARRRKRIDPPEAVQALRTIRALSGVSVDLAPHAPLLEGAWEIAREQEVTLYDAVYVALADRERTSLASRDQAQLTAARNVGVRVLEV
jgi:predicted nucleic acid-binding protein